MHFLELCADGVQLTVGAGFQLLLKLLDMLSKFSVLIKELFIEGGKLLQLGVLRIIVLADQSLFERPLKLEPLLLRMLLRLKCLEILFGVNSYSLLLDYLSIDHILAQLNEA